MVLDEATISIEPGSVVVDCTADGLPRRPVVPIFDGLRITVQPVIPCQQVASAALIAHVEALDDHSDDQRNQLCPASTHPASALDWIRMQINVDDLMARWSQHPELLLWISECRLTGLAAGPRNVSEDETRWLFEHLPLERARLAELIE